MATACKNRSPHFAPLLSAHLKHASGFIQHLANLFAFFNRQRERLFAVHVFAGLHGFDRNFRVPVVRRDNGHCVDVVAVKYLAVVFVNVHSPSLHLRFRTHSPVTLPRVIRVHVANRGNVAVPHRIRTDAAVPPRTRANAAKHRPIRGRRNRSRGPAGKPVRHAARGKGECSGFEKVTPILMVRSHLGGPLRKDQASRTGTFGVRWPGTALDFDGIGFGCFPVHERIQSNARPPHSKRRPFEIDIHSIGLPNRLQKAVLQS